MFEYYHGICDNCSAPIMIDNKFWAVLIAQDEYWEYHLLVNFIVFCFNCCAKTLLLKTNRYPFEVSNEFAAMKMNHESEL